MKQHLFFQYLELEKRYSPHTLKAYQTDLSQFFLFLQKTYELSDVRKVRHLHIRSWMVDLLNKGVGTRSINRKLSCLKTYFKFLRKRKVIEANPMAKVIAPKVGKRLPQVIGEKQMSFLLENVEFGGGYNGIRNRLIMELFYCTGIRCAELVGLQHADLDLDALQLKVRGKGNKERLVPLAQHLVRLLNNYVNVKATAYPESSSGSLFLSDKGQPITSSQVYKIVRRYLSLVTTADQRSPHVLRHSFATHLSNNGADLNAIKELLGHSSLAATQVYTHNSIEKLRKVYEQAHPKAKSQPIP
ncbi:MAG: integrase [Bacteroidetes bacterium]|nr:MAG: integrase [Bacteroidota bacterium]